MIESMSVDVSCRCQDNGDGGFTVHCYNDDEALLADHPLCGGLPPTPEQRSAILNEDDPYETGYISHERLSFIRGDDGVWKLDGRLRMHFGQ